MIARRPFSQASLIAAAFGVLVCAVGIAVPRISPAPRTSQAGLAALHSERERLASRTTVARDALRAQVAARFGAPWNSSHTADLRTRLGSLWQLEKTPSGASESPTLVATARNLELSRWADLLSAIQRLEQQPGIVIERFDLNAAGSGASRRFTRATITLRVLYPHDAIPGNPKRPARPRARSRLRGQFPRDALERSRTFSSAPPVVADSRPGYAPSPARDPSSGARRRRHRTPNASIHDQH